jgi:hypothetical protein
MPRFTQQHDAERVIDLRIGQQHAFDRHVANRKIAIARIGKQKSKLIANVWRSVEEEPAPPVYADGH